MSKLQTIALIFLVVSTTWLGISQLMVIKSVREIQKDQAENTVLIEHLQRFQVGVTQILNRQLTKN